MVQSLRPDPAAFWNVNLAPDEHTVECPAFLQYCCGGGKDKQIIGTPDSLYHRLTWQEVKEYVVRNRPDLFQRTPSDLRKYRHFCYELEGQYGSVLDFIIQERLQWSNISAKTQDFERHNYRILYNDWPYGIDKRIVHLVVWTKFMMDEDPKTGQLVPDMQRKVDAFVDETFNTACGPENVVWFRNWTSLKSVLAVEHIHVMLFAPDPAFIDDITGGDRPLAVKLGYIEA